MRKRLTMIAEGINIEIVKLPENGYVKLDVVLKFLPVGRSTWYEGIKNGVYPAPIKIGRASLWRTKDLIDLLERINLIIDESNVIRLDKFLKPVKGEPSPAEAIG